MKLSAAATLAFAASASAFTTPAARSAIVSQKGETDSLLPFLPFDSHSFSFVWFDGSLILINMRSVVLRPRKRNYAQSFVNVLF